MNNANWLNSTGELIQVLIGLVTLILAIIKGVPEIRKAIQDWKNKIPINNNKKNDRKVEEKSPFGGELRAKYLDLAVVLMCAAYFSLVIIDAVIISGRTPDVYLSLIGTLIISIIITISLLFLWYRNKAEFGIGWGAIITLALLIIAPGGPFFIEGSKGSINGVNLWLPVPILSLLAITMWIYYYGHPLDRTLVLYKRVQIVFVLVFIILFGTISLGKQFQIAVNEDPRTPKIASSSVKELLDSTNNWRRVQKNVLYATASDTYLISKYFDLYQTIQNTSATTEQNRKDTISFYLNDKLSKILSQSEPKPSSQTEPVFTPEESDKLASDIIAIIDKGNGIQGIYLYLKYTLKLSENPYYLDDFILKSYANYIYQDQLTNFLRKTDINQAFDNFISLPTEQQALFLADRLKWIHATGGNDENLITTDLPGITPEDRFQSISHLMIDHALSLQFSRLGALCSEFNYDSSISEKYCPKQDSGKTFVISPFPQQNNNVGITPSIFPDLDTPDSIKKYLQAQLSLPSDYEAYLALKEYSKLARNLLLEKETNSLKKQVITSAFSKFDSLDSQVQIAFIYYVINYGSGQTQPQSGMTSKKIYDTIMIFNRVGIHLIDKDGKVLDEGGLHILSGMIRQGADPNQIEENPFSDIARAILLKVTSQDQQEAIRQLLNIQEAEIPIRYILNDQVFEMVQYLDRNLIQEQKDEVYKAVSNPISVVVPALFSPDRILSEKDFPVGTAPNEVVDAINEDKQAFTKFIDLSQEEQQSVLHRLSISLYDAKGSSSLNIFELMVAQANANAELIGLIVSSFLWLPLILLVAILATYLSRQLASRDRLYQLLLDESSQPDNWQFTVGTPDIIHGRDELIQQLNNLASRGWGSIAVVGRRGVGKTRILLEMMQRGSNIELPKSITAWIATPSRFEESELIESVLERLTANVENAISKHLGAKPLEVRRLETNITIMGVIAYLSTWIILAITFYIMSGRVASDQITSTWFPIFIVSIVSAIALAVHLFNIQPVDLSSWLERDRSSSPHTVLLYRDAKRVLRFLQNRKNTTTGEYYEYSFTQQLFRWMGILVFGVSFFFTGISGITSSSYNDIRWFYIAIAIISGLIVSALIAFRPGEGIVSHGYSLLSLIAEYRGFIDRTVFRIRHGALGDRTDNNFEIIICIDELDKIIIPSELLAYLRRMKVIFEIPGAYYFLSISEDALHTLYLGAAEGKNEVDSTFDHIIRIPPANCDLGEQIAQAYMNKHMVENRGERIDRMIATISYGVPRDIIRRCDELLSNKVLQETNPRKLCDDYRETQSRLAYSERYLTKDQLRDFNVKAEDVIIVIKSYLDNKPTDNKGLSIVLSLWVLALIAVAVTMQEDKWKIYSEKLRDLGYRILEDRIETLIEELNAVQQEILSVLSA